MSLTFYPRDFKMSTSRDEYDGNFCRSVGHRILCGVLDTLDEHFILAYKSNELHYLYNQVRDDWGRPWLLDGNTPPAWITYWLVKLKEKQTWMEKTELICKEVRTKVSNKSWIKVKPVKKNPRLIEFPQDVFNVIKDFMDVVDVPTPVWDEMMSKSIKEITAHRRKGTGPDYYKSFPEGTNLRKVKVAEKRQRYFVGIIKIAKENTMRFCRKEDRQEEARCWIKAYEYMDYKRGPVKAYLGFEATDYTMLVNNYLRDLVCKNRSYDCGITSMVRPYV